MHIRTFLLAGALLVGQVICGNISANAVDLTSAPVAGPVCTSLEDLQAMFIEVSKTGVDDIETTLASFNKTQGRHCVILQPVMVEHPLRLGTTKSPSGDVLEIYSFEVGTQTYFIGLLSELTYA